MAQQDPRQSLLEKYRDSMVKADAYFVRSMAMLPQHTQVKVGNYALAAAPAWVSFSEIKVLMVLTPGEQNVFARFLDTTVILILFFDSGDPLNPLRFHLRMSFVSLTPTPGREQVCLAHLKFKLVPPAWVEFLEPFYLDMEYQRNLLETRMDQWLEPAKMAPRGLGLIIRLVGKSLEKDALIRAITPGKVKLLLPADSLEHLGPQPRLKCTTKGGQTWTVDLKLPEGASFQAGEQELLLGFSPELIGWLESLYRPPVPPKAAE